MASLLENKFVIGSCIAGLIGWNYGVPNLRYIQQMFRLGYCNVDRNKLPSETVEIEFTVSLTDIDHMRHMNNAAYFRYAEAGRLAWFVPLDAQFRQHNLGLALLGLSVKFRRECKAGDVLVLQTRVCWWDQCSIYIRHDFYQQKSGLMHCVMYCRLGLVQKGKLIRHIEDERGGFHALKWYTECGDYDNDYKCREEMDESLTPLISHLQSIKAHKL